jgi:hypothetical protein
LGGGVTAEVVAEGSGELSGRVRRRRPYGELRYVVNGVRILKCDSRCVQGDNG